MNGIKIAIEITRKKYENFRNYLEIAKAVKKLAKKILNDPHVRVMVFGSVVKGTYNPLSDLDILVISVNAFKVKYGEFMKTLEKEMGEKLLGVEMHLITPEIFETWYKRFLDKDKYVEV